MSPTPKRSLARLVPLILVLVGAGWYGWYRWKLAHAPYEWSGTVEARTASLGSHAGGRVKQVLVTEGDRVKPGQRLVVLEPGDWPAQLAQAQAKLAQAQGQLDKLRAGARPEELAAAKARAENARAALQETAAGARSEAVAAGEARVAAQQVAVEKAQLDAARMHKLAATGAAVPADVDNADIALKTALAQRAAAQSELDELKNGARREQLAQARARAAEQVASEKLVAAGSRTEDLAIAEAQVEEAHGRVAQVQTMVDELTIRAPVAARVESLDLRPGDIIAANATAMSLVEDDQLYVRIFVPETVIGRIQVGQQVDLYVDSFPDQVFKGIVQHINSVGEYSPRNLQTADERADQVFATRVGITSGAEKLRAGMAAFLRVPRD